MIDKMGRDITYLRISLQISATYTAGTVCRRRACASGPIRK